MKIRKKNTNIIIRDIRIRIRANPIYHPYQEDDGRTTAPAGVVPEAGHARPLQATALRSGDGCTTDGALQQAQAGAPFFFAVGLDDHTTMTSPAGFTRARTAHGGARSEL